MSGKKASPEAQDLESDDLQSFGVKSELQAVSHFFCDGFGRLTDGKHEDIEFFVIAYAEAKPRKPLFKIGVSFEDFSRC